MDKEFETLKILVVEDQPEARALIRNMLGELGVTQIFEASDGVEGMQFMESAADYVSIILCDWNMPGMSGLEFLQTLRKKAVMTPFLMITGRGDMESVMDAKENGVSGYIRKPFSPVQLEVKLRILLERIQKAA